MDEVWSHFSKCATLLVKLQPAQKSSKPELRDQQASLGGCLATLLSSMKDMYHDEVCKNTITKSNQFAYYPP